MLAAIEQKIHPSLVIARRQQRAEQIEHRVLGVLGHGIVSPCLTHQTLRVGPVAAPDHRSGQREFAFGRQRRFVLEPGPHGGIVTMVVPKRRLDAPAEEAL